MKEMCYNTNQGIPRCKEVQKFIWPANCTLHPNFLHKNGKDFFFFFLVRETTKSFHICYVFVFGWLKFVSKLLENIQIHCCNDPRKSASHICAIPQKD